MLQALANYSHAWKQNDDHKAELLKDAATLPLFLNISFQIAGGDVNLQPGFLHFYYFHFYSLFRVECEKKWVNYNGC